VSRATRERETGFREIPSKQEGRGSSPVAPAKDCRAMISSASPTRRATYRGSVRISFKKKFHLTCRFSRVWETDGKHFCL
jgi:hypothetical protein